MWLCICIFSFHFFSNFYHGLYKIPMIDQWGAVNGPTSGLRSWPQLSENVVVMVLNVWGCRVTFHVALPECPHAPLWSLGASIPFWDPLPFPGGLMWLLSFPELLMTSSGNCPGSRGWVFSLPGVSLWLAVSPTPPSYVFILSTFLSWLSPTVCHGGHMASRQWRSLGAGQTLVQIPVLPPGMGDIGQLCLGASGDQMNRALGIPRWPGVPRAEPGIVPEAPSPELLVKDAPGVGGAGQGACVSIPHLKPSLVLIWDKTALEHFMLFFGQQGNDWHLLSSCPLRNAGTAWDWPHWAVREGEDPHCQWIGGQPWHSAMGPALLLCAGETQLFSCGPRGDTWGPSYQGNHCFL